MSLDGFPSSSSMTTLSTSRDSRLGTILLTAMMVFPRSYAPAKIVLIACFIGLNLLNSMKQEKGSSGKLLPIPLFYLCVALLGIVWSVIGMVHGGFADAFPDYLRLYVAWSGAFYLLLIVLRRFDAMLIFHKSAIYAGIIITAINVLGIYDYYYGAGIFPTSVLDELELRVGFHDGYTQVTSHNIGSLLFVCGYLTAWECRRSHRSEHRWLAHIALFISLAMVIYSGRRALWLGILGAPLTIAMLATLTRSWGETRYVKQIVSVVVLVVSGILFAMPHAQALDFLKSAFSAEDARTIQSTYLIDGFKDFPIFGSGFGLSTGYLRSYTAPWLYELTYHQILFNFGAVGTTVIVIIAVTYFKMCLKTIALPEFKGSGAFEMTVGLLTFMVGTYSNPYLGSFDFLLIIAILPLLASYSFVDGSLRDGN